MDPVSIAPRAQPPVCKIMDYGKYCFEKQKREKEAKKKQQTVELKEIRISYRIDTHDYETKLNRARKFLSSGNKVRVVMKFRGREMSHMAMGRDILEKFFGGYPRGGELRQEAGYGRTFHEHGHQSAFQQSQVKSVCRTCGTRFRRAEDCAACRTGNSPMREFRKPSGSYFRRSRTALHGS